MELQEQPLPAYDPNYNLDPVDWDNEVWEGELPPLDEDYIGGVGPDAMYAEGGQGQPQTMPRRGADFDWSVLNVQTREEFDGLTPGQQDLLKMMKRGVKFTGEQAAEFVMGVEQRIADPLYQANVAKAARDAEQLGVKVPTGYQLAKHPETGALQMEMVPGSLAEQQQEAGKEFVAVAAQTVVEDVDRALKLVRESPGWTTGMGQMFLGKKPGSDAMALRGMIDSIKGNVGIDSLTRLKQSGVGLGQIPQAQLDMLASLMGNLDPQQRAEDLEYNLDRIRRIYSGILARASGEDISLIEMIKTSPAEAENLIGTIAESRQQSEGKQALEEGRVQPPAERMVNGKRFIWHKDGYYVPAN